MTAQVGTKVRNVKSFIRGSVSSDWGKKQLARKSGSGKNIKEFSNPQLAQALKEAAQ